MITYEITGILGTGITWEDFVAPESNHPSVTIDADTLRIIDGPDEHGWYDALVDSQWLTEASAKSILAEINNVSTEEIQITQHGIAIAVG